MFGSVNAQFVEALKKASQIHKSTKGPFDVCILLGSVFGSDETINESEFEQLISGEIEVALPVYFDAEWNGLPQIVRRNLKDGKICEGLFGMGKNEVRVIGDIKLACAEAIQSGTILTSTPDPHSSKAPSSPAQSHSNVDIVFTDKYLPTSESKFSKMTRSRNIELMRPRYCFTTSTIGFKEEILDVELEDSTPPSNHSIRLIHLSDFLDSERVGLTVLSLILVALCRIQAVTC